MTDQTVTLRLIAENGQMVGTVRASKAELDSLGTAGQEAGRKGGDGIQKIGDSSRKAEKDVSGLGRSMEGIGRLAAGVFSVAAVQRFTSSFIAAADRAGQLQARMANATATQQEYNYAMERSASVARNSYQSINQVAEVAINAAGPMRQLGFTVRDTLDLTEALSLSLVASAANQQRSAAAIDQFSKAMQTGVLRGQEFQTILQTAPRFITALEDALGKTRAELIAMANAGELTIAELTKVSGQLHLLREDVERMPTTVEDARVRFSDAFQEWAGATSTAINANQSLVKVIEVMASAIPLLTPAITALAVAIGGRLVGAMAESTKAAVTEMLTKRAAAQAELAAARAAEQAAAQRLAALRATTATIGQLNAAEGALAAATARTTAATQAASLAFAAKTRAVTAAKAAMALFGGPVGLAVTALTAFVLWATNANHKAKELADTVSREFQRVIDTAREFTASTADEGFAELAALRDQADKTAQHLVNLVKDHSRVQQRMQEELVLTGEVNVAYAGILQDAQTEIDATRHKHAQLTGELQRSYEISADLIIQQAGVTSVTKEQRSALIDLLVQQESHKMRLSETIPLIRDKVASLLNLRDASLLTADGIRQVTAAIGSVNWDDFDKGIQQQLVNQRHRYIELTSGAAAATRSRMEDALDQARRNRATPEELATRRAQIDGVMRAIEVNDKLAESQRSAARASSAALAQAKRDGEQAKRLADQRIESQRRYTNEAALAAAEMQGPLRHAEEQRRQRVAALDEELRKGNITQAAHNTLVAAAIEIERKRRDELDKRKAAPAEVLGEMRQELELLAMIGVERERHARRLRAEEEMRRAITEAQEAEADLSQAKIAALHDKARAYADLSILIEEYAADLEQLGRIGHGVISGMADLFADLFSGGIRKGRDFFRSLRDIFRQGFRDIVRLALDQSFVRPLTDRMTAAITQAFSNAQGQVAAGSGGFAAAGQSGGWMQQLMGGLGQVFQRWFSGGGAAGGAGGSVFSAQGGVAAMQANGVDIGQIGGVVVSRQGMQAFAGKAMPWLAAGQGAAYGWNQAGDTVGKVGAATSYGIAAYAGTKAAVAGAGALAGGGGLAAAGKVALKAIPVVGWIALAAIAIDKLSGGKLFGTKFKADSASQQFDFSDAGAVGNDTVTEVRNRSLFRGRKWRTTTKAVDAETQRSLDSFFDDLQKTTTQAAGQLGVDMPQMVAASFRREFDSKGNLTNEFGTIAGRVYREAQEAFSQRLVAENLLAVAGQAGSAAEIQRLADDYRDTPQALTEYATLMLAVQSDIKNARQVWSATGDGVITRVTELMEQLGRAGESLAETYQRISEAARSYGTMMADAQKQIEFHGLNEWQRSQVEIELAYRSQVRQAHELAKQLGLTGARSEDLARLEQLRAINMAKLEEQHQRQANNFLDDLALGNLSPLRDAQKLSAGMDMLRQAVTAGDLQRAQQLSQQVLGIGRNLYASGADYNALYGEVTGLLDSIGLGEIEGLTDARLADIADLIEGLPDGIARALVDIAWGEQGQPTVTVPVMPGPAPVPVPGSGSAQQDAAGLPVAPSRPALPDDSRRMVELLQQIADQGERIERLEIMRDTRDPVVLR